MRELTDVLGLKLDQPAEQKEQAASPFIDLLVELRTELRQQKLWSLSDQVRDRLAAQGVTIEDSKDGSTWRWG
jgi:cysteinyl-tRNA synthetase